MSKHLNKKEKIFGVFGIGFMFLDMFLLIDFYIVGTVIGLTVLLIFMIGTMKKQDSIIRFSKIWMIVFLMFVLLNPNPIHWNTQISRRWMDNRINLIEPGHSSLPEYNETFYVWFELENGYTFDEESDFETQVRAVDEYVRTEVFIYTLDQVNYGGYMDHIASMDEIIESKDMNGKLHDDCDGISIFTASLLIYMGFTNTYISEVTYHYHVMVYEEDINPKSEDGYLKGITLYRGRVMAEPKPDKISYYMFNSTEIFIPPTRPLIQSVGEILVDGNIWKFDITELYSGDIIGLPEIIGPMLATITMYILMLIISIIGGFGFNLYVQAGINDKLKSDKPRKYGRKKSIIYGLIIFSALTIGNLISIIEIKTGANLTVLCNPILVIGLILTLKIADNQFT